MYVCVHRERETETYICIVLGQWGKTLLWMSLDPRYSQILGMEHQAAMANARQGGVDLTDHELDHKAREETERKPHHENPRRSFFHGVPGNITMSDADKPACSLHHHVLGANHRVFLEPKSPQMPFGEGLQD